MKAIEFLTEDITKVVQVPGGFQIIGPDGKPVSPTVYRNRALANQARIDIDNNLRRQAANTPTPNNTDSKKPDGDADTNRNKPDADDDTNRKNPDDNDTNRKKPGLLKRFKGIIRFGWRTIIGNFSVAQRLLTYAFFGRWLAEFVAYITQINYADTLQGIPKPPDPNKVPVRDYSGEDWVSDPYIDYKLRVFEHKGHKTYTGRLYEEIETALYNFIIMATVGTKVARFISKLLLRISNLGGWQGKILGITQFLVSVAGYMAVRHAVINYSTWSNPVCKFIAIYIMGILLKGQVLKFFAASVGVKVASVEGIVDDGPILSEEEIASLVFTWSGFIKSAAEEIRSNPEEYPAELEALKLWEYQQRMQSYEDSMSI